MTPICIDEQDEASLALVKEALPRSADRFVKLIGIRPTLALVAQMGGSDIRFPRTEKASVARNLAAVVGRDHTRALLSQFGGREIYLPSAYRALITLRNLRIIADYGKLKNEVSIRMAGRMLAQKYQLSVRAIENVVNKWTPPNLKQRTN